MSHWSGTRESHPTLCYEYSILGISREIERGNLSIQSLKPVSGHILTYIGRAEIYAQY